MRPPSSCLPDLGYLIDSSSGEEVYKLYRPQLFVPSIVICKHVLMSLKFTNRAINMCGNCIFSRPLDRD